MPHNDPDPTDPMTLHGVVVETEDDSSVREMADCFIEEYIRTGFEPSRIMEMFRKREYAGPHLAYHALGEQGIRAMLDRHAALRAYRKPPAVTRNASGGLRLRILE